MNAKFVMVMVMACGLSACGNTISGVGKDVQHLGEKVTAWQEKPAEAEVKEVKNETVTTKN